MDLPGALKGFDMAIWESFRALRLVPRVVPVLRLNRGAHEAFLEEYKSKCPEPSTSDLQAHSDWRAQRPPPLRIGRHFPLFVDKYGRLESYEDIRNLCDGWSRGDRPKRFQQQRQGPEMEIEDPRTIRWLTKPDSREVQLIYTAVSSRSDIYTVHS